MGIETTTREEMVMAKRRNEPLAADKARVPAAAEVSKRMATLHGQARADLERDDRRGASSPLGGTVKRKGRGR